VAVGLLRRTGDALRRAADELRQLPPLIVDAGIAVVCYLATVVLPVKSAAAAWPLFVLAGLASVPLVWRRRYPVAVAAAVGAGTVGLAVTQALDGIPLPYGQLVATYTVAALAPPLWRASVVVGTAAGLVVSVLVLLDQRPSLLGAAALPFVAAYAVGAGARDRLAMVEERARRLAEQQHAAAVAGRERIARDIHDIVAHSVSVMVVQAEAGTVLAGDPGRAAASFETISAAGREALTQLGRALGLLRDGGPGSGGLGGGGLGGGGSGSGGSSRQPQPGLDDLPVLLEQARRAGLVPKLEVRGRPQPVPADLAVAVYRLVQEAMTNTFRHAQARRLDVRLDWRPDELRVEVDDDGRGPAPSTSDSHDGHGLAGMRERVRACGGRLHTGSGTDGTGFRVSARLPLGTGAADG
jgi:signal transduction histidine kinase